LGRKITVVLDNELDEKFRETVFKVKGMRKGNIQEAVIEALKLWIEKHTD